MVPVGKALGVAMKAEGLSPDVFAHVLHSAMTDHSRDMQKRFGPAFLAETKVRGRAQICWKSDVPGESSASHRASS